MALVTEGNDGMSPKVKSREDNQNIATNELPLRVGIIGHGAIGRTVANALRNGRLASATLSGVYVRGRNDAMNCTEDLEQLVADSDVIVEAAGHDALRAYGVTVLNSGTNLIVVSTGALADELLLHDLQHAGPGHFSLCPGAIGGLDLLRSVTLCGSAVEVMLTSTKRPKSLRQKWMTESELEQLDNMTVNDAAKVLFDGSAREAAIRFPQNANVAATLALAAPSWESVHATIIADESVQETRHVIEITASMGTYRFEMRNRPSPENPSTSELVSFSVLRCIAEQAELRCQ